MKFRCVVRAFEAVPKLAVAAFTLVIDVLTKDKSVLAVVAEVNEALAVNFTLAPPTCKLAAATVNFEPVVLASACKVVPPVLIRLTLLNVALATIFPT